MPLSADCAGEHTRQRGTKDYVRSPWEVAQVQLLSLWSATPCGRRDESCGIVGYRCDSCVRMAGAYVRRK